MYIPYGRQSIDEKDIQAVIDVLQSDYLTTGPKVAASSNCILYCGGTPVFADIDENSYNIAPEEIEKKITNRTTAICN